MFDIIKLQCGLQSSSETSVILASPVDKKYSGIFRLANEKRFEIVFMITRDSENRLIKHWNASCYVMAMAKYSQSANLQLVTFDHCVPVIRLHYDRQPE